MAFPFIQRLKSAATAFASGSNPLHTGGEQFIGGGSYSWFTLAGPRVNPASAMQQPTVYRCVSLYQQLFSMLPMTIKRKTETSDGKFETFPATDHPLWFLLTQEPNSEMSDYSWKSTMMKQFALRNDAYSYIEHNGRGEVAGIWPIHNDRIQQKRDESGAIVYEVTSENGKTTTYPDEKILHFKDMSEEGNTGVSPLDAVCQAISAALAVDESGAVFFRNSGSTQGYLTTTGRLMGRNVEERDEERKRIQDNWAAQQTKGNRHKTPVLDQDLKFNEIGTDPQKLQMLETRQWFVEEICRIFGVPPVLAYDMANSTAWGTGISEMLRSFGQGSLQPKVTNVESEMRRKLLMRDEKDEYFISMDMDVITRTDRAARVTANALEQQWGTLSINEIRSKEGRNPIEDGDTHYYPANEFPVGTEPPGQETSSDNSDLAVRNVAALNGSNGRNGNAKFKI